MMPELPLGSEVKLTNERGYSAFGSANLGIPSGKRPLFPKRRLLADLSADDGRNKSPPDGHKIPG